MPILTRVCNGISFIIAMHHHIESYPFNHMVIKDVDILLIQHVAGGQHVRMRQRYGRHVVRKGESLLLRLF